MCQQRLQDPGQGLCWRQPLRLLSAACDYRRYEGSQDAWEVVGGGQTNADGRVPDLLPPAAEVAPGTYRYCTQIHVAGRASAMSAYMRPSLESQVPFGPLAATQAQACEVPAAGGTVDSSDSIGKTSAICCHEGTHTQSAPLYCREFTCKVPSEPAAWPTSVSRYWHWCQKVAIIDAH